LQLRLATQVFKLTAWNRAVLENLILAWLIKFVVNFRFVWPCIINVGKERTNRWNNYRCLFTIV